MPFSTCTSNLGHTKVAMILASRRHVLLLTLDVMRRTIAVAQMSGALCGFSSGLHPASQHRFKMSADLPRHAAARLMFNRQCCSLLRP
jgi:hypothetical protein